MLVIRIQSLLDIEVLYYETTARRLKEPMLHYEVA